jgi:hypothetical protein
VIRLFHDLRLARAIKNSRRSGHLSRHKLAHSDPSKFERQAWTYLMTYLATLESPMPD